MAQIVPAASVVFAMKTWLCPFSPELASLCVLLQELLILLMNMFLVMEPSYLHILPSILHPHPTQILARKNRNYLLVDLR